MHRDLKLANVLLTEDSPQAICKLGDFGLARILPDSGMTCSVVGTPLHMAPELFEKKYYDIKADLWSLGTIIYHMLFG